MTEPSTTESTEFYTKVMAVSLATMAVIAVTATLMHLRAVMVPFVLSLFLYFMVSPLVDNLEDRFKLPRSLSVLFTLVLAGLMVLGLVAIVSVSLKSFFDSAPLYHVRLTQFMNELAVELEKWGISGFDLSHFRTELETARVFTVIQRFTGQFMGLIGNFFLILIFLVFMLLGQARSGHMPQFMTTILTQISKYVWTKFVLSLATGVLVGAILAFLGLDLAFMFGVLAFLLNFIPSVGSIFATLLPIPVAILQFGLGLDFALAVVLPGLVQFSIGNVIEPKLMGKSLGLHPATLLFFLIFWGIVWGIPGMFLAVPITAIVKFVLSSFPQTKRLANIMAGQPFSSE
ncbi:MAG: AI-2E family transporter [Pseudobdellovibrionaceae bacterium]|nr:AI-2E family transporter [Bdellovibrionales bacterium]USN46223.1 MAG: AI-2E family transporter [Pseudobdellovibrionaceae bacterium]